VCYAITYLSNARRTEELRTAIARWLLWRSSSFCRGRLCGWVFATIERFCGSIDDEDGWRDNTITHCRHLTDICFGWAALRVRAVIDPSSECDVPIRYVRRVMWTCSVFMFWEIIGKHPISSVIHLLNLITINKSTS